MNICLRPWITLGGEIDNEYNVINSGKGIYIGKPVIQELQTDEDNENEIYIIKKHYFPRSKIKEFNL